MITYVIPCLLGLEKLVADEVKRLGLSDVLAQFPSCSFEELFQGTKSVAWEEYLPLDGAFPVKGYSINSQLHAVPACQSIIKKAVVDRMAAHYGVSQFPETGTKHQIRFSIMKDDVAIGLDTSGEGLYKRGYRAVGVEAPLRETLAAALVTLSRYRGRDPFCDPFCPHRQKPRPRPGPPVRRPEVGLPAAGVLAGRGGGGPGQGVSRPL